MMTNEKALNPVQTWLSGLSAMYHYTKFEMASTIFLLGSALEGILLGLHPSVAVKDQAKYMTSKTAPKDMAGSVKKIYDWKLAELIDSPIR